MDRPDRGGPPAPGRVVSEMPRKSRVVARMNTVLLLAQAAQCDAISRGHADSNIAPGRRGGVSSTVLSIHFLGDRIVSSLCKVLIYDGNLSEFLLSPDDAPLNPHRFAD